MSIFFVLGALDRLLGNKFGLGGEFERAFGKPAAKKRKLYNGMIKCDLYMYFDKAQ
jgi:hypothetical protein